MATSLKDSMTLVGFEFSSMVSVLAPENAFKTPIGLHGEPMKAEANGNLWNTLVDRARK